MVEAGLPRPARGVGASAAAAVPLPWSSPFPAPLLWLCGRSGRSHALLGRAAPWSEGGIAKHSANAEAEGKDKSKDTKCKVGRRRPAQPSLLGLGSHLVSSSEGGWKM